ncbi:MAG: YfcE family phosphodiesterase [Methanobrevibacter sp.]|jgi:putative phosphoesterase|nr:YfcE family phosphodiesterase [Candidatus Methanoflexus mossambicus]
MDKIMEDNVFGVYGSKYLVGLISDTHVSDRAKELPATVFTAFKDVDFILHAGDIIYNDVLEKLKKVTPEVKVFAVLGNMDSIYDLDLEESKVLTIGGVKIGLKHGQVRPKGDIKQLESIARELDVDVLVSGHTHKPLIEKVNNITLVNPGSPTVPRIDDPTVMLMKIEDGEVDFELVKIAELTCSSINFANEKKKEEDNKSLFYQFPD